MNILVWRNFSNKSTSIFDQLAEMMRDEIVNEDMIDHHNRLASRLPPPHK